MEKAVNLISSAVVPLVLACAGIAGLVRKRDVFGALGDGAYEGLRVCARLAATLCALLTAVCMLRACGLLDTIAALAQPLMSRLGIPSELTPLLLIRPFSGSGSLAAAAELMKTSGADSIAGRMAAVMLASSETTLYTAGIYLSAAGVRRSRYTFIACMAAELTAFAVSAAVVNAVWG